MHTVHAPASDQKFLGDEPEWKSGEVTDATYQAQIRRGLNWHMYCAKEHDYVKYLDEWIKEYYPQSISKKDLATLKAFPANKLCRTTCTLARLELRGFPLDGAHKATIEMYVIELLKPRTANPVKVANGSAIQDRIRQQVSEVLADLDAAVDILLSEYEDSDILDDIRGKVEAFRGPQLKLVTDHVQAYLNEWTLVLKKEDEQLNEAYQYISVGALKDTVEAFQGFLGHISKRVTKMKSQRMVNKKPADKKKLASKIKFLAEFSELGLKSLPAVNIIGASMLWVYDTKKRRIGYYQAEVTGGLYINTTKIYGFGETCSKILRKPEEQLEAFAKLRKNQTVNWLAAIKAKCGTLTGRTNANLILLRIDS